MTWLLSDPNREAERELTEALSRATRAILADRVEHDADLVFTIYMEPACMRWLANGSMSFEVRRQALERIRAYIKEKRELASV